MGHDKNDIIYYLKNIHRLSKEYSKKYPNDEPIYHRTLAEILGYPKLLEILENANGRRIIFKYNEEFTDCTWEYVEE